MTRPNVQRLFLIALLPLTIACGSTIKTQGSRVTPGPVAAQPAPAVVQAAAPEPPGVDPALALIATSDEHFKAGQRELEAGHFEAARDEFNQAVDVLLESSFGGRTEPRIREHFDRLVDRISAYEVKALAEGDGFTEKKSEPASIDDLLALSMTLGSFPVLPDLKDSVQSDLSTDGHDLPIPLNQRVLAYIALFQGRLHDFIEDGMKRGGKYLPMIQNVFRAEGLPLDLAYVPLIESAFKPTALSRTKALGVWQFMAGTALENGLHRDWYIDERSDPEKATVAAAKYLGTLADLFDRDWHLALASYNVGPGRMQRALKVAEKNPKNTGPIDFWKLAADPRLLPQETREYVPMILAAIVIARNPAQYGFDFVADSAPAYETVTLPRPADLRRIAEWSGTTIDEIQTLNPELRRWTTPIRDHQYELKVPAGTAERVQARLDEAPAEDLTSLRWYTVKSGETLAVVAKKLHVSRADLAEANYLSTTARLSGGARLMVPHETTVLMAANASREVPVAEARATVTSAGQLASATTSSNRVKVIYEVKSGDTLASIARIFKTSVASLRTWNGLPSNTIAAGAHLTIYRSTN